MKNTKLSELCEMAQQRSNVYGLLAVIYGQEPTEEFLREMKKIGLVKGLLDLGFQFEEDFLKKPENELALELAVEFARLFLGPDKHISPYESVYHKREGEQGLLWGEVTVEVKKMIEASGLQFKKDYGGIPDHIGIELEFMSKLIRKEKQAWKKKDVATAIKLLKIEKRFIDEHLSMWVPLFCEKIIGEAKLNFYREMAKLTKEFILSEGKEITQLIRNFKEIK
ncbi:MAG: molecular chaperone [Candidatus Aminicenantia bacterium]